MKFITAIVLTGILAFAAGLYADLPWWSLAITSFIVAIAIHQKGGKAFLSGFLGVFLLWVVLAFLKDTANDHILSTKVANILPLGGSYLILIIITGILGGLVAGLSAIAGSYLRQKKHNV